MTVALAPYEIGTPRRRFTAVTLKRYALTQPEWRCQRCGITAFGSLELDHMVELVAGGFDHPYNLIRFCSRCHRAKPFYGDDSGLTPVEIRLAIITWAHVGQLVQWEDPDDRAWRKETFRLLRGGRR